MALAVVALMGAASYEPRVAEDTVPHGVVRDHLESFLREAAARTDGGGLPRFIERDYNFGRSCRSC